MNERPEIPAQNTAAHSALVTDPARAIELMEGATIGLRFKSALWRIVGQRLMRLTFHNWYRTRRWLLTLFGARIHPTARIRPTVRITNPWNLSVGANTAVGDHAILFCLGPVSIGDRCTISQYAHLCSASHDHTRADMALIRDPIRIEDDAWIAADVFVGPGVTIGADTVVGARATVLHSRPPKTICVGDNARPVGPRVVRFG